MRWPESPVALLSSGAPRPQVFVIIGDIKVDFKAEESQGLMKWVGEGGRLVVDRHPSQLLPIGEQQGWGILTSSPRDSVADARADDAEAMTAGVAPVAPAQPTNLTRNVERVAPSRYSGSFIIKFVEKEDAEATSENHAEQRKVKESIEEQEASDDSASQQTSAEEDAPPPPASREDAPPVTDVRNVSSPAPVEHLEKAVLIDYAHGAGRVVLLGEPFIVANTGIGRADNLQLALNLVGGCENLIAFDEYHQGYGLTRNELFTYFAGTPVPWMFVQGLLVALVVVWTRGRRFARPLPQADRVSKLEFIRSMAELQGRARAYDLAVGNIYTRTRRALARFGGVAADASRGQIAESVASRSGADRRKLEDLMRECEEAVSGNKISAQTALRLTAQLREVEGQLGLRLRARELRQRGKH